jgi:hypothetical protein
VVAEGVRGSATEEKASTASGSCSLILEEATVYRLISSCALDEV